MERGGQGIFGATSLLCLGGGRFFTGAPLLPFGFGLSYTNWSYVFFDPGAASRVVSSAAVTDELRSGSEGGAAGMTGTLASLAAGPGRPLVDH